MKTYTGFNIQYPISQSILEGIKTIETRTYPIAEKYLGKELILIETPGKTGKFKARAIAIIKTINCFQYKSKEEFYKDYPYHLVDQNSPWKWDLKPKFGWEIIVVKILATPVVISKKKGIIYTKNISL